jgi:hypothetical protein
LRACQLAGQSEQQQPPTSTSTTTTATATTHAAGTSALIQPNRTNGQDYAIQCCTHIIDRSRSTNQPWIVRHTLSNTFSHQATSQPTRISKACQICNIYN